MAFTVEDGTGLENSNAYISLAFATAYFGDRGVAAWTGSDTVKQQAIVRATDYIETRYGQQFRGTRGSPTQALSWPRSNAFDDNGFELTGVPVQLQKAAAEYALRALSASLMPDPVTDTSGQSVKMKKEVVGPIEETTEYHGSGVIQTIKPYPAADRLLAGLVLGSQGRSIRA